MVIKNGERTTGWAVAHDTVMANSPATLDLVDRAVMFSPPLQMAIVAPLRRDGRVLGALSAYSHTGEPFSDDHQYAMERIAAAFSVVVQNLERSTTVGVRVETTR